MKKKNLGLKIAALLLACGGFGAISAASNSTFAMDGAPATTVAPVDVKKEKRHKIKKLKNKLYKYLMKHDDSFDSNEDEIKEMLKNSEYFNLEWYINGQTYSMDYDEQDKALNILYCLKNLDNKAE